jgi:hypothetical protein
VLASPTAHDKNFHRIAFSVKSFFGGCSNGFPARPQAKGKPEAYFSHPPAPSCRATPSPMGYVEDFAEPRTTLESRFNIR